jgi:hypothetical protein
MERTHYGGLRAEEQPADVSETLSAMPDESLSRTSTITVGDRSDTRRSFRREATRDLDVRKAVRSVDDMAVGQTPISGWLDLDAVRAADGQRRTRWSDRSLVVFGGGTGIVALVVLVGSVLTVSENSTHPPAPARSSLTPSASPTAMAPSPPPIATAPLPPPTAAAPSLPPTAPAPRIAPPPATSTPSAQPAETPAEIAPPPRHSRMGPRRLHELFPYVVPAE